MIDSTGHPWHSQRATTLAGIASVVGVEAALRLSARWGGRRVQIPREPKQTSPLAVAIGLEAAQKLGRAMGGTHIDVPLGEGKRLRVVMLRVLEDWTVPAIAEEIGCGERYVYKVMAEHEASPILPELALPRRDPNQGDLFTGTAEPG